MHPTLLLSLIVSSALGSSYEPFTNASLTLGLRHNTVAFAPLKLRTPVCQWTNITYDNGTRIAPNNLLLKPVASKEWWSASPVDIPLKHHGTSLA